jgi:hypothetical protein
VRPSDAQKTADDVIRTHRASRCFCCSRGKLSALEISSTAEILGCPRFGDERTAGFLAVLSLFWWKTAKMTRVTLPPETAFNNIV